MSSIVELPNAVEMYARSIVLQLVVDSNDNIVAPVCLKEGTRNLTVHRQHDARNAVWSKRGIGDVEVVVDRAARLWREFVVISFMIGAAVR